MAEALIAFAAAGNALQFAQFGMQLLKKSVAYVRQGGSLVDTTFADAVRGLKASGDDLQIILQDVDSQSESDGPLSTLRVAAEECLRVTHDATQLVQKLECCPGKYMVWRGVRSAFRALWRSDELRVLEQQIQDARGNLITALLIYHQKNQHDRFIVNDSQYHDVLDKLNRLGEVNDDFSKKVDDIRDLIGHRHTRESTYAKNRTGTYNHDRSVDLMMSLTAAMNQLKTSSSQLVRQLQDLHKEFDHGIIMRRRILESIRPETMYDRRDRIHDSYKGTFEWLLASKSQSSAGWNDFLPWLSSREHRPIYWIFGKPGSGKSTLMKALEQTLMQLTNVSKDKGFTDSDKNLCSQSEALENALSHWLEGHNLMIVWSYFWNAGSKEQKSMTGFLRGLVHQFLVQRPDLITSVTSASRLEIAATGSLAPTLWRDQELVATLKAIISNMVDTDKAVLLVDGLDEFDGPEHEREDLINLISELTSHPHVKACVASRPWNVFHDRLGHYPKIQVEHHTRSDIEKVVRGRLLSNQNFIRKHTRDHCLLDQITHLIISKAQGVFLWVHLALRDLFEILRDGGKYRHLVDELDSLPADLDKYFEQIIGRIKPRHKVESAKLLLTAVCNLDWEAYSTLPSDSVRRRTHTNPQLRLFQLEHIGQSNWPDLAAKIAYDNIQTFSPTELSEEEEVDDLIDGFYRILNSRSMCLLEINIPSIRLPHGFRSPTDAFAPIDFIHRTLRDFLLSKSAQSFLRQYLDSDFDPRVLKMNLEVIYIAIHFKIHERKDAFDACISFLEHAHQNPTFGLLFPLFQQIFDAS